MMMSYTNAPLLGYFTLLFTLSVCISASIQRDHSADNVKFPDN